MGRIFYTTTALNDFLREHELDHAGGILPARSWVNLIEPLARLWWAEAQATVPALELGAARAETGNIDAAETVPLPGADGFAATSRAAVTAIADTLDLDRAYALRCGKPSQMLTVTAEFTVRAVDCECCPEHSGMPVAFLTLSTPAWANAAVFQAMAFGRARELTTLPPAQLRTAIERAWFYLGPPPAA